MFIRGGSRSKTIVGSEVDWVFEGSLQEIIVIEYLFIIVIWELGERIRFFDFLGKVGNVGFCLRMYMKFLFLNVGSGIN